MILRVGSGFDVHRLVSGRPLMLGGVHVAYERGLEGHSDGDCLLHALCDALLGAAAAGDMGRYFPSSDARWHGVASQLPMLALMIGYTCLGLWALSLPIGLPQIVTGGG